MLTSYKRILTFFAHPDDETLAAGGTIRKLCDLGAEVFVAIPCTGELARIGHDDGAKRLASLREDCYAALAHLGVKRDNVLLGDFPDNEIDKTTLLQLTRWLEGVIRRFKPDAILTHHRFCTNIDHQYCHEAAVIATRPSVEQRIALICGEVPSSTGYLRPCQWEPNFYVGLSADQAVAKLEAMAMYKNEVRNIPHPRSCGVLKALMTVRGSEGGFYYAEAFMLQKTFSEIKAAPITNSETYAARGGEKEEPLKQW